MTIEKAISKATLYFDLIGKEVKHIKKRKAKKVSRITAYKKKDDNWDVAVFFVKKQNSITTKPDTFLDKFLEKYEIISSD
jgi:hypothetical protein